MFIDWKYISKGYGSGLSGKTLTEHGHQWLGLDISASILDIALEREVGGDLMLGDLGQEMFGNLGDLLYTITGFHCFSLKPAGAAGEYTGLMVSHAYHMVYVDGVNMNAQVSKMKKEMKKEVMKKLTLPEKIF
ncbi:uncharacterized protein LOC124888512 isoform X4 [Capsicum annuum]|uniref:uncharacterized protein LOC124888512 isoform X4 n=1 Tax=Capsicum annuum TaxID=4072 RepID=UPI001FB0FCBF|nr:uncharacterized protein LOC124888512 isoform X4 [Capsicum annuum]